VLFLYNIFLSLYTLAIRVVAPFNEKAKKWIAGRRNWEQNMVAALLPGEKRVWIHCSSVGEFEQARPLIEAIKAQYPSYKTVITFFSPSGFEACKKDEFIDYIFYLPADSRQNAIKFIRTVNPAVAMFVKYEFWYHYLCQLQKQGIPALLISGAFREGQVFFRWYGGLFRKMLNCFSAFFLQDKESEHLLHSLGFAKNVFISGDTRYDRVAAIATHNSLLPAVEKFVAGHRVLIAGSTWPGDEDVINGCMSVLHANWKLIIAPHEVDREHVKNVQKIFPDSVLYSDLSDANPGGDKKVLIINNIGMLSRLYAYGDIAFVGGGFQADGIHNILEPAVFGLPVIFGPYYEKFVEAKEMVAGELVFPVRDSAAAKTILEKLTLDETYRNDLRHSIKKFMQSHTGATKTIMSEIASHKWLN
jgi:3-deoxy-D-manno-octulosonic-acid transferase